ncbi:MAG TPA: metal-dependent hydrolase [Gemmatimonadales bacterium]|jgi:inner membrane protein|nr:metal-dependent hydrolase [Gemmatimonadales bacterium]
MDNLCHTLAGAALAESGLARRTAMGYATLLIAANLPDIDVLSYLNGPEAALYWRRGWTHGIVALVVLPLLLALALLLLETISRKLSSAVLPSRMRPGQILLLAYAGMLSHPLLDTLNTYGVHWLLPWSRQWTYGDALFIVDPWIILVLGLGVWASRTQRHSRQRNVTPERPARLALAVTLAYIVAMLGSSRAAEQAAARELQARFPGTIQRVMAAPVFLNPLRRDVVVQQGDLYRTARFDWLHQPHIAPASVQSFPAIPPSNPAVARAAASLRGREFLSWARFPVFVMDSGAGGTAVRILDLRYARTPEARFGVLTLSADR